MYMKSVSKSNEESHLLVVKLVKDKLLGTHAIMKNEKWVEGKRMERGTRAKDLKKEKFVFTMAEMIDHERA